MTLGAGISVRMALSAHWHANKQDAYLPDSERDVFLQLVKKDQKTLSRIEGRYERFASDSRAARAKRKTKRN